MTIYRFTGKRSETYLILIALLVAFVLLTACDAKALLGTQLEGKAIQTHVYNYTRSEIMFAGYHDARDRFDIVSAAPAGSTPFNNNSSKDLGKGLVVRFDKGLCCFLWRYRNNEDVSLKVVWLEVYNSDMYRQADSQVDDRSSKKSLSGSQWCEATVKVRKPYPVEPGGMIFHFLPDGSIEVSVAAAGVLEGYGPYTVEKVGKYEPSSALPICKNPIDNPWYLVPRKPHRE